MESWQENRAQRVPIMPWLVEFGQVLMMEALESTEEIVFVRGIHRCLAVRDRFFSPL